MTVCTDVLFKKSRADSQAGTVSGTAVCFNTSFVSISSSGFRSDPLLHLSLLLGREIHL